MDDLVEREGTVYKKFSDVPFTGQVEGMKQGSLKNGLREGSWEEYYNSGALFEKGDYKKGKRESSWVGYHENGQLWYKGDFKNGKQEGSWVNYSKNGQLEGKGDYKNGKREGSWVYYYDGSVNDQGTGTYKDGVKISD